MAVVVNVGAVMGAGISADVTDMTIPSCPHADSAGPYSAGTEASREWAVVSSRHARVGESLADTVGPTLNVRGRVCPFKTACRVLVWDFAFPSSSSTCTCPLRSEFFRIRGATAPCASSPPKTPLPRCRTGRAPTFLASSSFVLSRWANFLHSPPLLSGKSPAKSPCRAPPKGFVVSFTAFHERGFSVLAGRFIRGVLFEYGLQLQHLNPNNIQ
jgi:hypothetical protein